MLKQTESELNREELSEAAKTMSEILKPVNDAAVRHVSVKGYDVRKKLKTFKIAENFAQLFLSTLNQLQIIHLIS